MISTRPGAALGERVLAHVRGAEDGLPLFAGGDAGHAGPDPRTDAAAVDEPRDAHDDVDGFVLCPRRFGLAEEAATAKRPHHRLVFGPVVYDEACG